MEFKKIDFISIKIEYNKASRLAVAFDLLLKQIEADEIPEIVEDFVSKLEEVTDNK